MRRRPIAKRTRPCCKPRHECIEALNQRHGGERFFLFHRERKWCESEQKFIGWERKRGKLEELNDLIVGTRPRDAERLVYVGDPDQLSNVRFVITLDSDTQLPADTARRMIETLAHPLNQARFDDAGRVQSGYTIIQPRVSPSLPSTSGSPFSRLFSDPVGIDPYTNAVSDVYQDLTGEGSYHGKGIYDVRAFSRVLSGRFPEAWLLSHDLIEGAHVRVGLASDIELYDEFPQDYLSYIKRQHRWIRGDWQIADWIMPRVPQAGRRTRPQSALLVRSLEGLRQSAPQPAARRQPGVADGLLAHFLPGRVDRHCRGRHATVLSLPGAALHLGDHAPGYQGRLPRQRSRTICCGWWLKRHCCHIRPGWRWMPLRGSAIDDTSRIGDCWSGLRPRRCMAKPRPKCRCFCFRWAWRACSA